MSEPLYRLTAPIEEHDAIVLVSDLVPVEPDEKVATVALLDPNVVRATGVNLSANQAEAVVRVVLTTALGVSDE